MITFLVSLQCLRVLERSHGEELRRESLAANELVLRKWIDLTNQPLRRFARDFAHWDALAAFVARPDDPTWADANLRSDLANHEAHAVWILDAAGRVIYTAQADPGPPLPAPLADPILLAHPAGGSFFAESRSGLLEIWRGPIASPQPGSAPRGWLLVARLWDAAHLASLSRLSEAELTLGPAGQPADDGTAQDIRVPLPGLDGQPLRHLVMRRPAADFHSLLERDTGAAYLFLAFAILVVLALWLAVRRWVLRPLDCIGESLARDNPAAIQPLLQDRTELGRVAQLVESSFRQRADLGREIEERRQTESALRDSEARLRHALDVRARLARDLHDGVIQSIYAAGLGLESAMTQLEKSPDGARARLQLCRQSLNDVIREVRGFISGIEPEALHHQGFDQELASLVRTMQALWPVLIQVQTNPALVARLTPTQELHALQICREAVSNAVRHGGARLIEIHLGEEAGHAFLRVRDDGRGFDPDTRRGAGSGLGNLAARARELGGHLQLESRPGDGTTVTVSFPLPPAASPS